MVNSQNGWPADEDRSAINVDPTWTAAGVRFPGGVKRGDVSIVFGYLVSQFAARVEKPVDGWNWGWAYRPVRGATSTSNHASGTAIDINAPRHPLGAVNTFTPAQRGQIRSILAELGGVVRWGGDYTGRKDEMHFEINANASAVKRVADLILGEDDMFETADRKLLTQLNDNLTWVRNQLAEWLGADPNSNPEDDVQDRSILFLLNDNLTWVRNQAAGWLGANPEGAPGSLSLIQLIHTQLTEIQNRLSALEAPNGTTE